MISFVHVNYWAVLAGGIISMITGAIWYSPKVFGQIWSGYHGMKPSEMDMSGMGKLYFWQFIAALIVTYVLAILFHFLGTSTTKDALMAGVWLWAGFMVAGGAGQYLFPTKPFNLFALDNIYKLINILIIAAVLVAWK
jgi:hypothetical protein